jgi:hypothetical protein
MNPAKTLDRRADDFLHDRVIGNVADKRQAIWANLGGRGLKLPMVAPADYSLCPFANECRSNGFANAATAAGNDGYLACQTHPGIVNVA